MDDMEEIADNQPEVGYKIRERTARLRVEAGDMKNIAIRVRSILDHIETVGLDLPIFLDAVCWGNGHLVANGRAKSERSALMNSQELPQILERWEKRSPRASAVLKSHALSIIKTAVDAEMESVVLELTTADEELGEEALLSITQQEMLSKIKPMAGTLWEILDSSTTRKTKSRNKYQHNPQKVRNDTIMKRKYLTMDTGYFFCGFPTGILPEPESKHLPEVSRPVPERVWVSNESF